MSMDSEQLNPKVSVILPTYNQSSYLLNAVQTILNQTYDNFELIIVNDGSTDETAAMLASMQHPKLRVITQDNQGLPSALNNGFAQARGKYWTWTSTDNVVLPIWLEELVKALDNSPADVGFAFSYYAAIDANGKLLFVNRDLHFDLPTLLTRHTGNASFLYRADLAKKVGPYDVSLHYAEDLDMWVRMASVTRAVRVETILYYYRLHANSMTSQQEKVREATKGVVNKFLAQSGGKFDIDRLFPSINLSADSALERWKARIRLVTLGANATFYCPVEAMIDQLIQALNEKYERGLVANIVHLLAKQSRWDLAAQIVAQYQQKDNSDALKQLASIIAKQSSEELQKIPFITIEEKFLAADCKGPWSQEQLLKNLSLGAAPFAEQKKEEKKPFIFEKLVVDLINVLGDQNDHPEVWQNISALQSPEEKNTLHHLRVYLTELIKVPQDPNALVLLRILEAVCFAYTNSVEQAKNSLQRLSIEYPNLPVLKGAIIYINQDKTILSPA